MNCAGMLQAVAVLCPAVQSGRLDVSRSKDACAIATCARARLALQALAEGVSL